MAARTSWGLRALLALAAFTAASSLCDDVSAYLDVPVPLASDTVIELDVRRVDCPALEEREELPEVIVRGGTLTLRSDSTVRFVNLRFTVEDGASLVFDMPKTQFGPNSGYNENVGGFLIDVKEGGSVTFTGKFGGREVDNVFSMFYNAGSMDFKGDVLFQGNGNVFRSNSGTLKFRGDTIFRDNSYLAIDNIDGGYVRFSKTAIFDNNGGGFDGADGCAIGNHEPEGTVIFRGDATFSNHFCDFAGAVYNAGKMRFYGKAYFNDNRSFEDGDAGGAVVNELGSLIFKGAAQFNRNRADSFGGGLSVEGGDVTFQKGALFSENDVRESGAAFSVSFGQLRRSGEVIDSGYGTLTFDKPDVVTFRDNTVSSTVVNPSVPACTVGYVEEGATLVGYPGDDVCVDKFA